MFIRHRRALRPVALALRLTCAGITPLIALAPLPATAQNAATYRFDIPAGPLASALNQAGETARVLLSFDPALVAGLRTEGLRGSYGLEEGLRRLLAGSGLVAQPREGGGYRLVRQATDGETMLAPLTVRASAEKESAWGPVKGYVARRSATATKTDTPIIETPQSISVVTKDFAEAIGATRLRDAMGYTPGINISPYGSDSRYDWVFIRGFDAYSPGYYLDGLQMRNTGTWGIWRTENYALERIEILRGPSSVLYGQNIPGGMVNAVSKRPSALTAREIQVQVGSYNRRQLAGDFTGALDEDGKVLYRVTGVLRDAELPAGGMGDDRVFLAPSLTWKISERTTLDLQAQYMHDRGGVYTTGAPYRGSLIDNPNGPIDPHRFLGDPELNRYAYDQWMFGYRLEHRFDDTLSFRQAARYGQLDSDYRQINPSSSFVTVNAGNPSDPANFRAIRRRAFGTQEKAQAFTLDNQLQADFTTGLWQHKLLGGFDYQRTHFDVLAYSGQSGTTIDLYNGTVSGTFTQPAYFLNSATDLVQSGIYLQDQIKFDERWVATLGGRYDTAKVETDDRLSNSRSEQKDHKFSGRAGLVYLAANGLAPYVSYSESFSPNTTTDPASGKPFAPETGKQHEIGLRYQPAGRKDSYSVALFDLRRQNMVTTDSTTGIPRRYGEIQVRGLELEAAFQPLERLNVTATWSFTPKAEVTQSANIDEIGKQANPVSRQQGALWADYRWTGGLKTGLGVRYVGSNHGTAEGTPVPVPSYTLFDALLGYDFGPWSLALNLRNLTDKDYLAQCGYGVCNYGDRRTVNATATYRW